MEKQEFEIGKLYMKRHGVQAYFDLTDKIILIIDVVDRSSSEYKIYDFTALHNNRKYKIWGEDSPDFIEIKDE